MRSLWIGILMGVGVLALISAETVAPVGPGRGLGGGMSPAGDPVVQRQEKTPESQQPPSPSVLPWTGTSRVQGGSDMPADHLAVSAIPFKEWKDWTVLLLVVAIGTAAGALVLWIATARARQPPGPVSVVTEAVLVVDLVESTRLATHYGDVLAMRARTVLTERTLAATEGRRLVFAKNTGDGSFMTFPSVLEAVQTATQLLKDLRGRPPDLSPGPPIEVRAGISYGEILLDPRETRHGAVINRAFRLEGLTREDFAQVEGELRPEAIPDRHRIFLDEEAALEVRPDGIPIRVLGFCSLKGFSGLHRVYEVLWDARG
jgi:class 3 adenylate cyclase